MRAQLSCAQLGASAYHRQHRQLLYTATARARVLTRDLAEAHVTGAASIARRRLSNRAHRRTIVWLALPWDQ